MSASVLDAAGKTGGSGHLAAATRAGGSALLRMRSSLAALIGCAAGLVVMAVAILLLDQAAREQRLIQEQSSNIAHATIHQLQGEVRDSSAVLQAFAMSPNAGKGFQGFYQPRSEGVATGEAWFALLDVDKRADARRSRSAAVPEIPLEAGEIERRIAGGASEAIGFKCGPAKSCWSLVARPVFQNGRIRYLFVNALPAAQLQAVVDRHQLPPRWTLEVFDDDGVIIARSPHSAAQVGDLAEHAMRSAIQRSGQQTKPLRVGDRQVTAALADPAIANWTAVVSIPQALANAPTRKAWTVTILFALGVTIVVVALSWLMGGTFERSLFAVRLSAAREHDRAEAAERRYGTYWRDTPDGLFTVRVTPLGRFVFDGLNPAHELRTGLKACDLVGHSPDEVLPRDIAAAITARYRQCVAAGRPITYEETLDLPVGRTRWETSLAPLRDATGEIHLLLGSARDVTERALAQERLEDARNLLQGSLDGMTAHVALLDEHGRITAVNQAWQAFLRQTGRPCEEFGVGAPYLDVCAAMLPALDAEPLGEAIGDLLAGRRRSVSQACSDTRSGATTWRQLRINAFDQGQATRFIATHEDVTEVVAAQAALRQASARMLSIQEEERQRIAVELHDSTSQHLVALGFGISRLKRLLAGVAEAAPVLEEMTGSIDEALKEIRIFSYLLHPRNLVREGLEGAVRQFIEGFAKRTGLDVEFRAGGPLEELNFEVQRTAFRVVQEALSNIHRHADATYASVELELIGGTLLLRATDNGKGIGDIGQGAGRLAQLGVGIPGMIARVNQLGGSLTIGGGSTGAVVTATIPIEAADRLKPRRSRRRRPLSQAPGIAAVAPAHAIGLPPPAGVAPPSRATIRRTL